jgi:alpha-L-fucosidase 2
VIPDQDREVWFAGPAEHWVNGLPVGNGRIGAMWYGDAAHAVLALNDETFWSPGPSRRDLSGARAALDEVRALLRAGDAPAAQRAAAALLGTPAEMAAFQPIGDAEPDDRHGDSRSRLARRQPAQPVPHRVP